MKYDRRYLAVRNMNLGRKIHEKVIAKINDGNDEFEVLNKLCAKDVKLLVRYHGMLQRSRKLENIKLLLMEVYAPLI